MSVSEIAFPSVPGRSPADGAGAGPDSDYLQCGECPALVERTQRYCVNCGAHQRQAPDPAARYMSHALARARAARAASARTGARAARRRTVSLGTAALIALIPIAGLVGLEIGDSSAPPAASATHSHAATRGAHTSATVTKLKSSTGNSYVNSQNSLPSTVNP